MGEWDGDVPGHTITEEWQREVQASVHDALSMKGRAIVYVHRPNHKAFAKACVDAAVTQYGADPNSVQILIDNLKRLGEVVEL